jgi:hypothetical protein
MATAKVITANGVSILEIKKGLGKSFTLEGDEFQQLIEYLQNEANLDKKSTDIQNGDGKKVTLNNKELRSLAEKLKRLESPTRVVPVDEIEHMRKALESPTEAVKATPDEILPPLPLDPTASTKQPVVHKPKTIQASKLQVISIQLATIEWSAYATCPSCKARHCLDIKQSDGTNQSQFAAQCECGQILFLQK